MNSFKYGLWRYKAFLPLFLIVFVVIIAFSLLYIFGGEWTGFKETIGPQLKPNQPYQPAKTLWDWLTVVSLPGTLAIVVAYWSSREQSRTAQKMAQMQAELGRTVESDSQRQATLQTYLDRITQLLLEKKMREAKPDDEIRNLVRAHTLMVLRRLDQYRQREVLLFLRDLGLIKKDLNNSFTHFMEGADLSEINLSNSDLSEADLHEVNFRNADLGSVNLSFTDLSKSDLSGANLSGANLERANLKGATGITTEELEKQARSLQGTIMPDGSTHP